MKVRAKGTLKTMIEILAHPTSDCNAAALSLQTKKGHKYVIGQCGEGLQRALNQNRNRMGKLQSIFLTGRVNWQTVGGLPGFLLTVTEQGAKSLSLQSAGNNLAWGCNSWRNFMFHNMLDLKIAEPDRVFTDEHVAIAPVVLTPSAPSAQYSVPEVVPQSLQSSPTQQDNTTRDERSSCFIVQILPSRGKFLPDRAKQLGVKPGFDFGHLSKGVSITTADGTVVTPDMVMEQPKTPPRVLVVDIPTPDHVQSAIDQDWTKQVSKNTTVDIKCVYHFLGANVDFHHSLYQQWMDSFGPNCLHYISHPRYCPNGIAMKSAEWLNVKLREKLPGQFTKLHEQPSELRFTETENVRLGLARTVTQLEPVVSHIDPEPLEEYKQPEETRIEQKQEPQVITLGTGSAIPSKYRNVLSSLVRVPTKNGWRAVLLDAGEGTMGTIKRVYGPDTTRILQEMKMLYISHLHADHHLGSMSVIRDWMAANPGQTLFVLGPRHFELFLKEWAQLEEHVDMARIQFIDTESYIIGQGYEDAAAADMVPARSDRVDQALYDEASISEIKSCRAFHCKYSYSVAIGFAGLTNFKIAFSGDTRPNPFFARRVGQNCDVLIHEATHDNELADEARKKQHSTIGEAMEIAESMRARSCILTHFSQRYPKLPEYTNDDTYSGDIAVAFDGMQIYLSQIAHQQSQFEQLKQVFELVSGDGEPPLSQ